MNFFAEMAMAIMEACLTTLLTLFAVPIFYAVSGAPADLRTGLGLFKILLESFLAVLRAGLVSP